VSGGFQTIRTPGVWSRLFELVPELSWYKGD
jgi:hypothetical protein